MSKASYRRIPWIAATGIAIIDAYTRNSTPGTAGANVHSANATMANPTARAMTRVRARTSALRRSRGRRAPCQPSATAGHAWRMRYCTAGAAHSSHGTTYGLGIASPLMPMNGDITTCAGS